MKRCPNCLCLFFSGPPCISSFIGIPFTITTLHVHAGQGCNIANKANERQWTNLEYFTLMQPQKVRKWKSNDRNNKRKTLVGLIIDNWIGYCVKPTFCQFCKTLHQQNFRWIYRCVTKSKSILVLYFPWAIRSATLLYMHRVIYV